MNNSKNIFSLTSFTMAIGIIVSCSRATPKPTVVPTFTESAPTPTAENDTGEDKKVIPAQQSGEPDLLPTMQLIEISPENVQDLEVVHRILPFYPPISTVSGDLSVIAVGDNAGVRVYDAETQVEIMRIKVELPDCNFGFDAFLTLDFGGQFLGITTSDGIEVWEVGGGKIYQANYLHGRKIEGKTCGLDIPQIAISPGGKYLAESGLGLGGDEFGDYFRVIKILDNEEVYSWDGNYDSLHGQLSTFSSLGFSSDGAVLQTFDPGEYQLLMEDVSKAFMLWSTDTWQQVDFGSEVVSTSVSPGEKIFALSENGAVHLLEKGTGDEIGVISNENCDRGLPCEVIFSPDGKKAAILNRSDEMQYDRKRLITSVDIFSTEDGEVINTVEVLLRHKYALGLSDDGRLVYFPTESDEGASWWSNTAYISGFKQFRENRIVFHPQIFDVAGNEPMYSGTCTIDFDNGKFHCKEGVAQLQGSVLHISQIENGFVLSDGDDAIAQVKYPPGGESDIWQIRLQAYQEEAGIGYFCLDRNYREETCVIMNFNDKSIIKEKIDMCGFVYSGEEGLAAFIDRDKKEFNIFREDTGRLKIMQSYLAIAYPVKPALFADGERALYIVHNTDTDNLFIEEISLVDAAVIRRYNFDGLSEIVPTAISTHPTGNIWVVGDNEGNLHFLDPKTRMIIHSVSVSRNAIVDTIFADNGTHLLYMEESGVISLMGVAQ